MFFTKFVNDYTLINKKWYDSSLLITILVLKNKNNPLCLLVLHTVFGFCLSIELELKGLKLKNDCCNY